jgi:hypothetical protein
LHLALGNLDKTTVSVKPEIPFVVRYDSGADTENLLFSFFYPTIPNSVAPNMDPSGVAASRLNPRTRVARERISLPCRIENEPDRYSLSLIRFDFADRAPVCGLWEAALQGTLPELSDPE